MINIHQLYDSGGKGKYKLSKANLFNLRKWTVFILMLVDWECMRIVMYMS